MAYQGDVYRAPAPQRAGEALHVVQQPQVRPRRRSRVRALRLQQAACFTVVLAIAGVMIYSHVNLTRLTNEVSIQQGVLDDLNSEYIALKARQDQALSLSYVEQYAQNTLGMVKLDTNQVEYVEMNNPDQIEVRETGVSLRSAMSGLAKSFTAVLEYLE
ncbi:hypothetical protein LI291_08670 [Intestinibacillus massiliensis]|uniref:hypothetical protein n=1 Tax=Intestinibacillus massiliensis TaxID=1871029 RepID=UPI00117AC5A4|nr:hypothetical protein [Intestinibacillus massiliensis]MCB6366243.1 hypothetical protein [Intestinibacillus massiliensis]